MSNPAQLRQLMESPMVQSITSNPDLLRSLLLSNPQMRDLMEVELISSLKYFFFMYKYF
jgi:ubiquilin